MKLSAAHRPVLRDSHNLRTSILAAIFGPGSPGLLQHSDRSPRDMRAPRAAWLPARHRRHAFAALCIGVALILSALSPLPAFAALSADAAPPGPSSEVHAVRGVAHVMNERGQIAGSDGGALFFWSDGILNPLGRTGVEAILVRSRGGM